ncbi:hypothetical protein [Roseibium aggregatum]|uniref:Uncharacterized protein n=1 Tax=Roseibium aggregatum TaxID=187304 RepID=A0A926S753_9HYPH|nr:hypothetical protein [Roseibium aggregatum]MBD1547915.1 hypothetical protein [Roseibium aggregatum]
MLETDFGRQTGRFLKGISRKAVDVKREIVPRDNGSGMERAWKQAV